MRSSAGMEKTMSSILYVVVPCYNEEEVLPETSKRLKEKMTSLIAGNVISDRSRVIFVMMVQRIQRGVSYRSFIRKMRFLAELISAVTEGIRMHCLQVL